MKIIYKEATDSGDVYTYEDRFEIYDNFVLMKTIQTKFDVFLENVMITIGDEIRKSTIDNKLISTKNITLEEYKNLNNIRIQFIDEIDFPELKLNNDETIVNECSWFLETKKIHVTKYGNQLITRKKYSKRIKEGEILLINLFNEMSFIDGKEFSSTYDEFEENLVEGEFYFDWEVEYFDANCGDHYFGYSKEGFLNYYEDPYGVLFISKASIEKDIIETATYKSKSHERTSIEYEIKQTYKDVL